MVTKKVIPIKAATSWSFSRYSDYKSCPLKFKLKHIDRHKEPGNAAMDRGANIHTLAENYIKGKLAKLPPELKTFEPEFKQLKTMFKKRSQSMVVEDNWAFTKNWDETAWDNWTECYLRIKLDCAHHIDEGTMVVTDWKTGKFREEKNEEYVEQLELYALAALILHPHLEKVMPRLAYTDIGVVYPEEDSPMVFTQDDVPRLKKLWEKRVKPMFADKKFAPRANASCRYCWFSQSKKDAGGPGLCKY